MNFKKSLLLILVVIITIILFDSKGILNWSTRLQVNKYSERLVNYSTKINSFSDKIAVSYPKENFEVLFKQISGVETQAGYDNLNYDYKSEVKKLLDNENLGGNNTISSKSTQINCDKKDSTEFSKKIHLKKGFKVLLVGDSMMDGISVFIISRLTSDSLITVKKDCKNASGLARLDYFNWFSEMKEILKKDHYNLIVVLLGTNDGQGFYYEGKIYPFLSEIWKNEYYNRVDNFIKLLSTNSENIIWYSLPPMRDEKMMSATTSINSIIEKASLQYDFVRFIKTTDLFGNKSGEYISYVNVKSKQIKLRQDDGIHISIGGGQIFANNLYLNIKKLL